MYLHRNIPSVSATHPVHPTALPRPTARTLVMNPVVGMITLMLLAACSGRPVVNQVRDHDGLLRAVVTRRDGVKDGPVRFFAADGSTTTGRYVDDSRHGPWVTLGPAGDTLAIVTYEHGKKDGLQAYWAPNGQLLRVERFRDGGPHGVLYRFFADGSPRQVTWYDNGMPEGAYMEWYKVDSTSIAVSAGQFHQGKRTGRWTWFYGNGKPQRQGWYREGRETGVWRWWDPNGKLARSVDHGQP